MANEEHVKILKQGIETWNTWRERHTDTKFDLSGARLTGADLRDANLSNISLYYTDLSLANLSGADLSNAWLVATNFSDAQLTRANFERASIGLDPGSLYGTTYFINVDLSDVKGLETVLHEGPSTIDIDTIVRSKGKIPVGFLRGCGVPEPFIENIPSLIGALSPIDFYSCFISCSSQDKEFANRLCNDLRAHGVRCWYYLSDMRIGDKIRTQIDTSILIHDKLLLILSQSSVVSQWVEQEVETALAKERKQNSLVLFPIRLDDAFMEIEHGWPTLIYNTRHVGDFTNWRNHGDYQKAFDRLLYDLKATSK